MCRKSRIEDAKENRLNFGTKFDRNNLTNKEDTSWISIRHNLELTRTIRIQLAEKEQVRNTRIGKVLDTIKKFESTRITLIYV